MLIFPVLHKTLVLPMSSEEVIVKIQKTTKFYQPDESLNQPLFRGEFHEQSFQLILDNLPPHNSLPLIRGKIEGTRNGSILFLKLSLLPSSQWYLWISFVLCLVCAAVFIWIAKQYYTALAAIIIAGLNYLILIINFKRKANLSFSKISELLSET